MSGPEDLGTHQWDIQAIPSKLPQAAHLVRVAALFTPEFRTTVPDLGYANRTSNEKARRILGWTSRNPLDAIVAAAASMVVKGLVKK